MNTNLKNNDLTLEINNIRAIESANIILDGITVIAGENGCGKSTIAKLTYHLFKTLANYDEAIDLIMLEDAVPIDNSFELLTRELSYFLPQSEYLRFRKRFQDLFYKSIFLDPAAKIEGINYLIEIFSSISTEMENPQIAVRIERIKKILQSLPISTNANNRDDNNIVDLLERTKELIDELLEKSERLKEDRPIAVLDKIMQEAFFDAPIPKSYNLYEYNVPIIDKENNNISAIHSVKNVAYIDTPMILGMASRINFNNENRIHWQDLNDKLVRRGNHAPNFQIDNIFEHEVLKGETCLKEEDFGEFFTYKRQDSKEFDLMECATGLKSFAILQMLYKNGFLNKNILLIIDEPEVHLHPQWVVEYARLIVLLNKHLGTKFLLSSHHPDMISAIKYISEKEDRNSVLHFYLAKLSECTPYSYRYEDLGTEIEDIFSSFNIALERIDLYGSTE